MMGTMELHLPIIPILQKGKLRLRVMSFSRWVVKPYLEPKLVCIQTLLLGAHPVYPQSSTKQTILPHPLHGWERKPIHRPTAVQSGPRTQVLFPASPSHSPSPLPWPVQPVLPIRPLDEVKGWWDTNCLTSRVSKGSLKPPGWWCAGWACNLSPGAVPEPGAQLASRGGWFGIRTHGSCWYVMSREWAGRYANFIIHVHNYNLEVGSFLGNDRREGEIYLTFVIYV